MSCLDNIVTLGTCAEDASSSGFTLLQAAGISLKNLDNIADDQYVQGVRLAEVKKRLAINLVRNDLVSAMHSHNVVMSVTNVVYDSSTFIPSDNMGLYDGERGVVIHGNPGYRGKLRKIYIDVVQCYPLTGGVGEIVIVDTVDGIPTEFPYEVTFEANKINTFKIDYQAQSQLVKVLIDNSEINFASAPIVCHRGCHDSMPNPCAWADGWDGTANVKREGYGINVKFYCKCDYDELLCQIDKKLIGELIWLKWQELVFDEQYKTNRFNAWVVYNREDLVKAIIPDISGQYNSKWTALMRGLFNILKSLRDDCLDCRGIRKVTNL